MQEGHEGRHARARPHEDERQAHIAWQMEAVSGLVEDAHLHGRNALGPRGVVVRMQPMPQRVLQIERTYARPPTTPSHTQSVTLQACIEKPRETARDKYSPDREE